MLLYHLIDLISSVYWGIVHDDVEALHFGILVHEIHCMLQEQHVVVSDSTAFLDCGCFLLRAPSTLIFFGFMLGNRISIFTTPMAEIAPRMV